MAERLRVKLALFVLIIIMVPLFFSTTFVYGQDDYVAQGTGKMDDLIKQQTAILQKLFAQDKKIKGMGRLTENITAEIEALQGQIADLAKSIAEQEMAYDQKKADIKQLFQSYQRMGPGSYLEIILDSSDLTDFLRRLNILRNITRNTDKLLQKVQNMKQKQETDKTSLTVKLTSLGAKQLQFNEALAKENQLKKELEGLLASLAAERKSYEKYLSDLQKNWDALLALFASTSREFATLIGEGKVSPSSFKISAGFFGIKGSITDEELNKIIARNPDLPQIIFKFKQGNVEMSVPDKNLSLNGTFVLQGGEAIKLEAAAGTFYGILLEPEALEELFQDGDLVLNFASLLRGFTISSLESMDGYLQFTISP